MKNVRIRVPAFVFALSLCAGSLAAVGCGGSVEQPQTQASAVTKAPIAPQTHGVVKTFGEALGEVPLRPEQRTELEQLALAAEARHATMGTGKKELMLAVADQVEKGTIDRAALQPKIDRIVADLEKARPDDNAALARMHAILDSEQRNAFVDALEANFKAKHHGGKHHGPPGGAGAVGDVPQGDQVATAGPMAGMHAMKELAEEMKLSDDQRSQIHDAIKASRQGEGHSFRDMHARMSEGKKVLESFRGDTFDANAVGPAPEKLRARAAIGTSHALTVAEKVVPVLTPDQRKIAADKIRSMANAGLELPFAH